MLSKRNIFETHMHVLMMRPVICAMPDKTTHIKISPFLTQTFGHNVIFADTEKYD